MDRMELKKRWLMGNIHPELFYLPWGHRKDLCRVYIYCNVYSIDNKNPDLETAKKNGVNPQQNYGFMIFDEKHNIVSDDSFCIPLSAGKYYAVHHKSVCYIDNISYEHKIIEFEVTKEMKELVIYVDGTTRCYFVKAKFKPELCVESKMRNWLTQVVSYYEEDKDGNNKLVSNKTRVVDLLEIANCNNYTEMMKSDSDTYQMETDELSTVEYYDNGHRYKINEYPTSLSVYPEIKKHSSVEEVVKEKLKVYFDIIEMNGNYNCIDYTFNIWSKSEFNLYSDNDYLNDTANEKQEDIARSSDNILNRPSPAVSGIYDSRFAPADRTWTVRNGWFVDEESDIRIFDDERYYTPDAGERNDYSNRGYQGFRFGNNSYVDSENLIFGNYSIYTPSNRYSKYHIYDDNVYEWVIYKWNNRLIFPHSNIPASPAFYSYDFRYYDTPPKDILPEIIDDTYTGDEFTNLYDYISKSSKISYNTWRNFNNSYDKKTSMSTERTIEILDNGEFYEHFNSEEQIAFKIFRTKVDEYFEYGLSNEFDYNNTYLLWGDFFVKSDDLLQYGYVSNSITQTCNRWGIYKQKYVVHDSSSENYIEKPYRYVVIHYTPISHYYYIDPETHRITLKFQVYTQEEIDDYFNHIYDNVKNKDIGKYINEYDYEIMLELWNGNISEEDFFAQYNIDKITFRNSNTFRQIDRGYYNSELNREVYGNRLILYIDEFVNITEDEYNDYLKGIYSENMKEIIAKQNNFRDRLNFLQNEYIRKYKEEYGEIPITELPKKDGD